MRRFSLMSLLGFAMFGLWCLAGANTLAGAKSLAGEENLHYSDENIVGIESYDDEDPVDLTFEISGTYALGYGVHHFVITVYDDYEKIIDWAWADRNLTTPRASWNWPSIGGLFTVDTQDFDTFIVVSAEAQNSSNELVGYHQITLYPQRPRPRQPR